jgi:polygalacturonase
VKIISVKNCQPLNHLFRWLLALLFIALLCLSCHTSKSVADSAWQQLPPILEQIISPVFPNADFVITDYGAQGDGETDCTEAFQKAIQICAAAGGGRVIVPPGIYLTGAIHLKSNVNLHLTPAATILFSQDENKYLPVVYTRFEGVECYNYSGLIYAYQQENIAITGAGTLDGQAGVDNWWAWKGNIEYGWEKGEPNGRNDIARLYQMSEDNIPVQQRIFGKGFYLRPNFIQTYQCKNVLIDSITIKRSPMWVIHPVLCENVTVQNVKVISHGPNNDGCNPESSRNIWIKNCYFDTGDDCIAIKSGRNSDGRRINVPSEYIIVQRCIMKDGHGGVVIGSEMSGSVRNIFVEDCQMDSPNLDRAIRIKTNSLRGGIVEKIYVRNLTVGEVREAVISVNFNYGEGDVGNFTPTVRNIYLYNVSSRKSKYAILLEGYERSPIANLMLENCSFNGVNDGNSLNHYENLTMTNVYINGELQ